MSIFNSLGDVKSILQLVVFLVVFTFITNVLGGVSKTFHTITHPMSWFEKSKETLKEENANLYVLNKQLKEEIYELQAQVDDFKAYEESLHEQTWGEWIKGDSTRLKDLDTLEQKAKAWW